MDDVSVLDRIDSPADVKALSDVERERLAEEIRACIIDTVSRTGGHLASNLGVIELAIALHTAFDSPTDKLIWDVGHQCYAHKLITGRKDGFAALRQAEGVSGFTSRWESEHDAFGAGHASTSISAALGMAKARDLRGGREHVVALVGDGAMTGGLALEGLNNAAQINTDLIVVLNDNRMSISENVGALAAHLAKLRMKPLYRKVESRAKRVAAKMPAGKTLVRTAEGIYHGVTHLWGSQTGIVFEEMGFTYLGPIDGHNMGLLIDMFEHAKLIGGPVLIHAVTRKGKGYEFAENNCRDFHGIPGFHVADGAIERSNGNTTYTQAFAETLVELAGEDERIIGVTAAMPDGTGLAKFAETYPDRFFDVGIAEGCAVTFAAGLAAGGLRPVVAIYSTFLQRAYDQILHDVCIQNLPVVFAIDRAGVVGEDGATHQGVFDLSYLRHIPRLAVACPSDTNELRDLLATALRHDGPFALRYPRGGGPSAYEPSKPNTLAIGRGAQLLAGDDAVVIAIGSTVCPSLAAAALLADEGLSIEVINARFVKPLDEELILAALAKRVPVLIAEDNALVGGFGCGILELAASTRELTRRIHRLGVPDAFLEHDSVESLRAGLGLTPTGVADALRNLVLEGRLVADTRLIRRT